MATPLITLPKHIAYTQALKAEVKYNLSHSCGQSLTIAQLLSYQTGANESLSHLSLDYASVQGSETLRRHIADFHQAYHHGQQTLSATDVVTFSGAQEGLAAIYHTLLSSGDEVVVFTPSYPSLVNMVSHTGACVKTIPMLFNAKDNRWQFDLDALCAAVNERTKLIVINSPHNPSGAILTETQKQQVLQIAKTFNCYLLCDDVTQPMVHKSAHHNKGDSVNLSHHFLDYENTIVVSVLSKSFGLAGVRLGWVVSRNTPLLEQLIAFKTYGSICTSAVDEYLAEIALTHAQPIIANNLAIIEQNKACLTPFLEQHGDIFSCALPQAGFLAVMQIKTDKPLEHWLHELLDQSGVLLLPTHLFGLSSDAVRLGLGQKNFGDGLQAISKFVQKSN